MVGRDSGDPGAHEELLSNIRRLTIMVLDNLEEGSRDKTLDQSQKRLLSSTASRLLRLWKNTLKDDGIQRIQNDPPRVERVASTKTEKTSGVLES